MKIGLETVVRHWHHGAGGVRLLVAGNVIDGDVDAKDKARLVLFDIFVMRPISVTCLALAAAALLAAILPGLAKKRAVVAAEQS